MTMKVGLGVHERAAGIVQGTLVDAFAVLGMHDHPEGGKQLTVFLPGALGVSVVSPSGKSILGRLQQLHSEGLFSGLVKRVKTVPYRLRVEYPLATLTLEDPYRFPSLLDETDVYLFNSGVQEQAWRFMGANHRCCEGVAGVLFVVWAPNARRVSVLGDFNSWDGRVHVMRRHPASGLWEIFIPDVSSAVPYKYQVVADDGTVLPLKADPYARQMQLRPETASLVPEQEEYRWQDGDWMQARAGRASHAEAVSIYEVHLGSWRRDPQEPWRFLSYRELADALLGYVKDRGFTHIQLLPVSEHPLDASWGYQPLGLFAPSSRFGPPADFKYFIDRAHQAGIAVLLDWVPGHFPSDEHGLARFDGTHLYEHSDPRKGFHPDWNTLIYNYARAEVVSYLLSNALYWLGEYHVDGLRFDAVASMLYLDYSRKHDEWLPNYHGGRENLEAIDLIRAINRRAYFNYPGVMMVAEESTAWPGVTDFIERGGLGFGFKWNLGWMNDTLSYMSRDPLYRKFHHNQMTFGLLYAFSENFILPLSHDEVVHGKGSLLARMPGDDWQKFAGLRAYLGFMWTHPGKKLLFMGGEFAQRAEWSHEHSLDWHLLDYAPHQGIQKLVTDLNLLYKTTSALYELDASHEGFSWIDAGDHAHSLFIYVRKNRQSTSGVLVIVNMLPTAHHEFRVGVPDAGFYRECLNSDSEIYGGSGLGNLGGISARHSPAHGHRWSLTLTLPPLSTLVFKREAGESR
ncbi:MAG: 1,4-alpha-glucan branching protein GlgB [Pseudomonadales bacterium]|nr:1,4-alpha-glucan branching protein GlgB [Pseudomonadales bacterium]